MGLFRLLFWIALIAIAFWLWRRFTRPTPRQQQRPQDEPGASPMVRCAHCGVHVPQANAPPTNNAGIAARRTCARTRATVRAERLRLSEEQGQRILRLYHLYRLTIGLVLVLLISSELEDQVLKLVHPELFHVGSWCYLVFNILVALFLPPSRQLLPIFILALTDVLMLCGLFYAGGGVPSGIGSLLVVAVAIANILLRGRIGLVIAAAASLGLLYLTFFLSLSSPDATNHYVQAGGLGTCASPPRW